MQYYGFYAGLAGSQSLRLGGLQELARRRRVPQRFGHRQMWESVQGMQSAPIGSQPLLMMSLRYHSGCPIHSPPGAETEPGLQKGIGAGTSVIIGYCGHHDLHELAQNLNANAFATALLALSNFRLARSARQECLWLSGYLLLVKVNSRHGWAFAGVTFCPWASS